VSVIDGMNAVDNIGTRKQYRLRRGREAERAASLQVELTALFALNCEAMLRRSHYSTVDSGTCAPGFPSSAAAITAETRKAMIPRYFGHGRWKP
jgi:hypothetical protein